MELLDDSFSQSYEYVDASYLGQNIILPEGCTTATITTEDGETVTLILSESIPEGDPAVLEELIAGSDSQVLLNTTADDQNNIDPEGENTDVIILENQNEGKNDKSLLSCLPAAAEKPANPTTNLIDFMESVTTYKCKYCRFSCPWKSGLVSHVRSCHAQERRSNIVTLRNSKAPNIVTAMKYDENSASVNKEDSLLMQFEDNEAFNTLEDLDLTEDSGYKFSNSADSDSDIEIISEKEALLSERHVFLCGQCSDGFMTLDDCRQHMINDHNLQLHQNKKQTNKRGRPRHSRTYVPRTDPNDGRIKVKKRVGRPPKRYEKDYYNFDTKGVTKDGINFKLLKCSYPGCGQRFSSEDFVQYHYTCHGDSAKSFICPLCDQKFEHWRGQVMHLWKEHQIDIDLVPCSDCPYKTYSHFKMANHRRIHSDERAFVCQICNKGFKQVSQLRNHVVIHMDRKNLPEKRWYSEQDCDLCGRKFSDSKCLRKHQQAVHSKLKPFVCSYCGHMSARKAMLELHMRQHTGEKPFQCDTCEYRTGDHNSLRRHRMRHTGTKPYKCPHCSYACIQAISYKTHLKNKHPGLDGVYSCCMCSFKSVSRDNYVNHMSDHERRGAPIPESSANKFRFEVIPRETSPVQMNLNDNALQQLEGILPGNITAAQLIYSCLSALSEESGTVSLPPGVTVNLPQNATKAADGSQTITIQLPTSQDSSNEPYYFTIQPGDSACSITMTKKKDDGEENVDDPESAVVGDLEIAGGSELDDCVKKVGNTDPLAIVECVDDSDPTANKDLENHDDVTISDVHKLAASGDLKAGNFAVQEVSSGAMDCNNLADASVAEGDSMGASNEDSVTVQINAYTDLESFTAVINADDSGVKS